MPRAIRPAFATLWNLDLAFAAVVSTSTDPRLGEIRLRWWSDRLDELDTEAPMAGEPRLNAADRHLRPFTNGAMLSMVAESWIPLLNPFPWGEDVANALRKRGSLLFGIGSQVIGRETLEAEPAGALWSLVDGAFHCSDSQSRNFLLAEARAAVSKVPRKIPKDLRPMTVLAALAASDLTRAGRFSRGTAAVLHKLRGTIPRA